jgi:ribosomal protein S18 acetylase RimI-like enzyme
MLHLIITRQSNSNAYELYKSMGYIQIAIIKNKYFLPSEDSIFMIKHLTDLQPQNTNP